MLGWFVKRRKQLAESKAKLDQPLAGIPATGLLSLWHFVVTRFALAPVVLALAICELPARFVYGTARSFDVQARRNQSQTFLESYQGYIIRTRWSAVGVVAMFIVLVLNVAIFTYSLYRIGRPSAGFAVTSAKFLAFWDGGAPPSGWVCVSCAPGDDFYQRFPRGAATFGGVGGVSTHAHTMSFVSSVQNPDVATITRSGSTSFSGEFHEMTTISSPVVDTASSLPPYRELKVIRYETPGNPSRLPTGVIVPFDVAPTGSWTRYTVQDNNYLYGENGSTTTGGTATHTHSYSGTASGASAPTGLAGAASLAPSGTHTHTFSGSSPATNHEPSRVDVLLYKTTAEVSTPSGAIGLWTAAPPSGWTVASGASQTFDQKFLRGAAAYATGGGAINHTPADATTTSGLPIGTNTTSGSTPFVSVSLDHTHDITVGFAATNNLPPYREVIIAEKDAAVSATVSGRIYTNESGAALDCSTPRTVALRVNGGGTYSANCSNAPATGSYSIATVSISAGDIITVFLDGATEKAVTVTRATNAGPSNLDLYQDRLIIRHEDDGPISNADLDQFDSGGDPDIPFTVTTGALTVAASTELHVWTGMNYLPGGTVTTSATAGDVHVDDNATMTIDTATSTIGRDLLVDGGATVTLSATTTVNKGIVTTGTANVTTTGTTAVAALATTAGTIGGGSNALAIYTLTLSNTATLSSNLTIGNNLTLPASVTAGSTTITMTGTSGTLVGGGATVNHLTIDPSSAGTITLNTSNVSVAGTLSVASGDILNIGAGRTITSTSTGAITLDGTITGSGTLRVQNNTLPTTGTLSSVVTMNTSVSDLNVPNRTYGGGLNLDNCGGTAHTITLGTAASQTLTVSGNLTISTCIFDYIVAGNTYNPTVNVTGNVSLNGSTGGTYTINMGSDTWTVGGNVNLTDANTLNHNGGTVLMNGTGTLTSNSKTLNNFTTTGGGTITLADATHTFAGNVNFGATGLTAGTSTVVMSGPSKTIDGGGTTINNLTVSGSVALQNSDLTVAGTLNISGGTLTLNSGRTLTNTGASDVVNTGTITGAGTLRFTNASGGPGTGGTLSSVVRYYPQSGNIANTTFDARTYGNTVELFNDTATTRSVTCAAGAYTISGASSDLLLYANGNGHIQLSCASGTGVTVGRDFDFVGTSGTGQEQVTASGNNVWTIGRHFLLTNGTYTATAGNEVLMTGTGNIDGNAQSFYKLTINGTNSVVTQITANFTVTNVLTVGATSDGNTDTFTISGGAVTSSSAGTVTIVDSSDTINGSAFLVIQHSNLSSTGNLNAYTRFWGNITMPARVYGNYVEIFTLTSGTVTMTAGNYTFTDISLNCNCEAGGTIVTLDGSGLTGAHTVDISGSIGGAEQLGLENHVLNMGGATWSVATDFDLSFITTLNAGTSTLVMDGTGTLTTNGKTLNNLSINTTGLVTLANATHTLAGNLLIGGSDDVAPGTSTITMTGTGKTIDGGGETLNNLTIGNTSGTITLQNTDLTLSGALTTNAGGGSLTIASGRTLTLSANTGTSFTNNGTVTGAGTLIYQNSATTFPTAGTVSVATRFDTVNGNMTVPGRVFGSVVVAYNATANDRVVTLGTGTVDIQGGASDFRISRMGSGTLTVDGDANDPIVNIGNDFYYTNNAATVISGSSTWTVAGGFDASGPNVFTATVGNTVRMSTSAIGDQIDLGANSLHNLSMIGSGSLYTNNSWTISNDFTISSGSVRQGSGSTLSIGGDFTNNGTFDPNGATVAFTGSSPTTITGTTSFQNVTSTVAGKTITFQSATGSTPVFTVAGTLTLTGTSGSRIILGATTPGNRWLPHFNVAQSSITYATIQDSGCDSGTANVTLTETSLDAGNNAACWIFPTTTLTVSDGLGADATYGGSASALSANWTISSSTNVDHYEYAIGTTPGATDVVNYTSTLLATSVTRSGLTLTSGAMYYVTVRARNVFSVTIGSGTSDGLTVDLVAPTEATTINDGTGADVQYSAIANSLSANWSAASDALSGLAAYELAFGTAPGGTDVIGFTSVGTTTGGTFGGLTLTNGTIYYATVRTIDAVGNVSAGASSNGVTVNTTLPQILDQQPDDTTPRRSGGTTYDVDFLKSATGAQLTLAEYAIWTGPNQTGTNRIGWTMIFNDQRDTYTADWPVDFARLAEGTNYVSVRLTALDGLTSELIDAFTVFRRTPATGPTLAPLTLTGGSRPAAILYGFAKGSQVVRVYLDGKVVGTFRMPGTIRETKTFSMTIDLRKLATGKHTLYAQTTDTLGRVSDIKDRRTFTVTGPKIRRSYLFGTSTVYVVANGDSLWRIARTYLGTGARYTEIVAQNVAKLPSLARKPWLIFRDWLLRLPAASP